MNSIPKFVSNPKTGELIAQNEEALEVLGRMTRTREQVIADNGISESEEINEEVGLRPGWVKVPAPNPHQVSVRESYRALGFSDDEATIAAGIERDPYPAGSPQALKESYMALGMTSAEADIAAGIER